MSEVVVAENQSGGITGTTQQCLDNFTRRATLHGLDLLASFCGVIPATALGWVVESNGRSKRVLPKGSTLLKLRVFLSFIGYTVSELEDLPEPARKLATEIAVGSLSVKDAVQGMEYKDEGAIYAQTLQAMTGLDADRVKKLEKLVLENEADALRKVEAWLQRLEGVFLPHQPEPPAVVRTDVTVAPQPAQAAPAPLPVTGERSIDVPLLSAVLTSSVQAAGIVLERLESQDPAVRDQVLDALRVGVGRSRIETVSLYLSDLA